MATAHVAYDPTCAGIEQLVTAIRDAGYDVRGGYDPDVIVASAGRPVRLHFFREEDTACSQRVVFPELGASAWLAPFRDTVVEVTPPGPGEYGFQCGMGMLRGRLIATARDA